MHDSSQIKIESNSKKKIWFCQFIQLLFFCKQWHGRHQVVLWSLWPTSCFLPSDWLLSNCLQAISCSPPCLPWTNQGLDNFVEAFTILQSATVVQDHVLGLQAFKFYQQGPWFWRFFNFFANSENFQDFIFYFFASFRSFDKSSFSLDFPTSSVNRTTS